MPNGSTSTTKIKHGENRGYQAHYRLKIPIDDLDSCGCRAAHREYEQTRRGITPRMSPMRERELIRGRAYQALARQFPVAFREFMVRETEIRRYELLKLANVDS